MAERKASVERDTLETQIKASIKPERPDLISVYLFLSTCWTRSPVMG